MDANRPTIIPALPPDSYRPPQGRRDAPHCTPTQFYSRIFHQAVGAWPHLGTRVWPHIMPPVCCLCEMRTGTRFLVSPPPRELGPIPFPPSGEVAASLCKRCARCPAVRHHLEGPVEPTTPENKP
jgi:hypothetical protein